ncbi:hypothetical protein DKX38_026278 [Salix brachista]|uniref:HMA domain-containing protein n=1 Tax=Salix brachista TaxID=2182728 RepID=A0A5N5JRQ3_9ROSI|nr:hypothetical protein DKX38_026278 [Salix brachista]
MSNVLFSDALSMDLSGPRVIVANKWSANTYGSRLAGGGQAADQRKRKGCGLWFVLLRMKSNEKQLRPWKRHVKFLETVALAEKQTCIILCHVLNMAAKNSDQSANALREAYCSPVFLGVTSVALDGADKDQIVVVGEEVDSVKLARSLGKKVGHASLMSVQEEKEKEKEKWSCQPIPYYYSQPLTCEVVGESNPNNCTVISLVPLKEVLKYSGLNLDELYAIELIGGVTSVALDGADKDQIVVVGEEVDSVKLARSLRKKPLMCEVVGGPNPNSCTVM